MISLNNSFDEPVCNFHIENSPELKIERTDKPGFLMITGDARIAQFVINDCCVEMETVLFSLPAIIALPEILAFEIENFLPLRS